MYWLISRQLTSFLAHAYRPRDAVGHERPLCAMSEWPFDEFAPLGGGSAPDDRSAFSRDTQTARLGRGSRGPDIRRRVRDRNRFRRSRRTSGTAAPFCPIVW